MYGLEGGLESVVAGEVDPPLLINYFMNPSRSLVTYAGMLGRIGGKVPIFFEFDTNPSPHHEHSYNTSPNVFMYTASSVSQVANHHGLTQLAASMEDTMIAKVR